MENNKQVKVETEEQILKETILWANVAIVLWASTLLVCVAGLTVCAIFLVQNF